MVARIVRPRGNRGEVIADLHTDIPGRFESLKMVWLEWPGGARERHCLEDAWEHKGRQVLKFAGIDSISAAERLTGAYVQIEASQSVELPDDTYYDYELIGCTLVDLEGMSLGTVEEILHIPENTLLVVRSSRREFFVPTGGSFFREVNRAERRIVVDLPEGLMDLNP